MYAAPPQTGYWLFCWFWASCCCCSWSGSAGASAVHTPAAATWAAPVAPTAAAAPEHVSIQMESQWNCTCTLSITTCNLGLGIIILKLKRAYSTVYPKNWHVPTVGAKCLVRFYDQNIFANWNHNFIYLLLNFFLFLFKGSFSECGYCTGKSIEKCQTTPSS